MATVQELERELSILTEIRNAKVETARAMMQRANAEYDRKALPLARKIKRLKDAETEVAPALPKPVHRDRPAPVLANPDPDWDQADVDHFNELRARLGKR